MMMKRAQVLIEVLPPFVKNFSKHHLCPTGFRNYLGQLKERHPDCTIVVTSRPKMDSLYWTKVIKEEFNLNVILNVTCIGETLGEIQEKLEKIKDLRVKDLLVLRGYSPKTDVKKGEFKDGLQFLRYLANEKEKGNHDFNLGVPAYPEGHPLSTYEASLKNFLEKVDSGAQFAITQASYDIEKVTKFYQQVREKQVEIPIFFGILPLMNKDVLLKKASASKVKVPLEVLNELKEKDDNTIKRFGEEFMVQHAKQLMEKNEINFCMFSMNSKVSLDFTQKLIDPVIKRDDRSLLKTPKKPQKLVCQKNL